MNEKAINRPTQQRFRTTIASHRRSPVRSHEVAFMRQRLEGELIQTREIHDAITALEALRRSMEHAENCAKKAATSGR